MLPAIIGGGAAIAGALIGAHGQSQTNAANAQEAQRNRDFQERMRSTQYQTAVDDMRKAGLNPALAYQQGGAGNVSGSTAQFQNPAADAGGSAARAIQTFQDMRRTASEIDKIQAEAENVRTNTQLQNQQTLLANIEKLVRHRTAGDAIFKIQQESKQSASSAAEAAASAQIRQLAIPEAQAVAAFYRSIMGKASPYINSGKAVAGGISQLLKLMRN